MKQSFTYEISKEDYALAQTKGVAALVRLKGIENPMVYEMNGHYYLTYIRG